MDTLASLLCSVKMFEIFASHFKQMNAEKKKSLERRPIYTATNSNPVPTALDVCQPEAHWASPSPEILIYLQTS